MILWSGTKASRGKKKKADASQFSIHVAPWMQKQQLQQRRWLRLRLIRLTFLPSLMVTRCIYSAVSFQADGLMPSLLECFLATRGLVAGDDATLATLLRQVSFLLGQYYVDGNIFAESGVHLNGR